jgi:hypothetical protein
VFDQMGDSVGAAAARGIKVVVGCPTPLHVAGAETRMVATLDELRMVVDESELLLALFSQGSDEVSQAIWSRSPYLALSIHRGLAAELAPRQGS